MSLKIPEEAKLPKTYEEWAHARHQQRQLDGYYKYAQEVGSSVSELYGNLSVEPVPYNCTCPVCYVLSVRQEWPTYQVDRIPRKAPASSRVRFVKEGEDLQAVINEVAAQPQAVFTWDPLTN